MDIGSGIAVIATIGAGSIFVFQSVRYQHAIARLDRSRVRYDFWKARARAEVQAREDAYSFQTTAYVMCGGCGANVAVGDDGFTPKYHSCFVPQGELDFGELKCSGAPGECLKCDGAACYFGPTEEKKIPIGFAGHLHTAQKSVG